MSLQALVSLNLHSDSLALLALLCNTIMHSYKHRQMGIVNDH